MFHIMASKEKGYYFNAIPSSSSIGWSVVTAAPRRFFFKRQQLQLKRWRTCIILAERADDTEEAKLQ